MEDVHLQAVVSVVQDGLGHVVKMVKFIVNVDETLAILVNNSTQQYAPQDVKTEVNVHIPDTAHAVLIGQVLPVNSVCAPSYLL